MSHSFLLGQRGQAHGPAALGSGVRHAQRNRAPRRLPSVATTATEALPVAKQILEVLNDRLLADPTLARQLRAFGFGFFYFHTKTYDGDPIPVKSAGGVSTTDLIYARLDITLTLAPAAASLREDLWDFCMKLVAKVPTSRDLPEKAKQAVVTQLNDLDLGYMFALLRAGLAHEEPQVARVVIQDALEQFEKRSPAEQALVGFARGAPLSRSELLSLSQVLAKQTRIGNETATLAMTWGVRAVELPPATPKDVLIALAAKRWDDARAMLESGVRMEDPGCRPGGAKLLLQHGADPTIRNWNGRTALDVAEGEIRALLTQAASKKPGDPGRK